MLDVLYAMLPRPALRFLRARYDRMSVKKHAAAPGLVSDDDREYLREFFREDSEFVESLLTSAAIQLGTGEPFDALRTTAC